MFSKASGGIPPTTSQKHRNFVSEPIGIKPVSKLPGIGDILGDRLSAKGFKKAYRVLGQFLMLNKDEELFVDWLQETCNANSKQAGDCYIGLKTWCDCHL